MQAIQVNEYGGPEQLKVVEIPKPNAQPEASVLVRVHAASFNPIEAKQVSGTMRQVFPLIFPFFPGYDFSGVIDSVAENISGYQPGDLVYGTSNGGAYAEFVAVEVDKVSPKPRNLSHVEAASFGVVAQTALQALDHAHLQAGQIILIHGAGGAVGSAAVQLAKVRGAQVIASGSAASLDRLRSYGADQVFDYKATRFESVAGNVDAVLDTIGGEVQQRSYAVLKPGGYLVAISQPPSPVEAQKRGVHALFFSTDSSIDTLQKLTPLIEAGQLKPHVAKTYPLSAASQAWQDIATSHIDGKVVFEVHPD